MKVKELTTTQLAIQGHPKQGKKVIEILEMLGGVNYFNLKGAETEGFYYIYNGNNKIYHCLDINTVNVIVYTLEEFEEKFPYKIDDVVINHKYGKGDITQMLWIDNEIVYEIKFEDCMAYCKANELCKYNAFKGLLLQELTEYLSHATREELDKTMEEIEIALAPFKVGDKVIVKGYEKMGEDEIIYVFKTYDGDIKYKTKNHLDTHYFMEDSLTKVENSYKEETMEENRDEPKAPILSNRYDYAEGKCGYVIPDGYEFDCIKEGFQTEIILKLKKPAYPKTYEECCEIAKVEKKYTLEGEIIRINNYKIALLEPFQKLLICRDAYWKIAGDEMGLNKSWEPNYDSGVNKYGIICMNGVVQKSNPTTNWERHLNKILDFPTEEMRDAFFENFKELIKETKELL